MDRSVDNLMPSPYRGRGCRGSGQQRRGGAYSRARRSSDFYEQQFASPYQDSRNTPVDRNAQLRSYGPGSLSSQYQSSPGGWQNNGRFSYRSVRGSPGSSYKKRNQYGQQEVDIRGYVIAAMTENPWRDLEKRWKNERISVGMNKTTSSQ